MASNFRACCNHLARTTQAKAIVRGIHEAAAVRTSRVHHDFDRQDDNRLGKTLYGLNMHSLTRVVNRGHPLLEQSLSSDDNAAWDSEWGSHAQRPGHGPEMAAFLLVRGSAFVILCSGY